MFSGILFLPLFYFIFLLLFGELKPKSLLVSGVVTYGFILFLVSYLLLNSCFFNFSGKYIFSYQIYTWSTIGNSDVGLNVWLDYVSVIMCFTVIFIASMVNMFSVYYMANDPFIVRFFAYLSLFTFCMLLLVVSSDLMQFFIGWELVGLCSFLLINFWYTRKEANSAATKAILVNRVGDFFFIFGMAILLTKFGSLSIYDISWMVLTDTYDQTGLGFNKVCLFFFIAVMSKSAQIGLHSWLPDAMEGPTPVSALIHAATMVTAGIYLLLRLSTMFLVSPTISKVIAVVGSSTAIFGATTGSAQNDIKKIIAFSTCSQLGYMVTACGLGQFNYAFFHLVTHAFFKSLLFLSAGSIIHTMGGEQDIRKMGFLRNVLPLTYVALTVASLALSGVPYLSGYYSKELIICSAFVNDTLVGTYSGTLLIIAAIFTSAYSAKLLYFVFFIKNKDTVNSLRFYHKENSETTLVFQTLPLLLLSIMSIFGGYLFKEPIAGIGSNMTLSLFDDFNINNSKILWVEFVSFNLKLVLNVCSFSGFIFYFIIVNYNILNVNFYIEKNGNSLNSVYNFFLNRWYIDNLASYFISYLFMVLYSQNFYLFIQKKIIDSIFVRVIVTSSYEFNRVLSYTTIYTPSQYVKQTVFWLFVAVLFTDLSDSVFALICSM